MNEQLSESLPLRMRFPHPVFHAPSLCFFDPALGALDPRHPPKSHLSPHSPWVVKHAGPKHQQPHEEETSEKLSQLPGELISECAEWRCPGQL